MRFDKNSATLRSGVFMNFNATIEYCVLSPSSHFFFFASVDFIVKITAKMSNNFLVCMYALYGDIDDNNSTSSFANRKRFTFIYYKWNHTRFSPCSRTNGIWNILFRLDGKRCQQQQQKKTDEEREEYS